jgi:hypothetical protein
MNTYKIHWKWRDRSLGTSVLFASLTEEERQCLSLSLMAIADHVDVSRFYMDRVDADLVSDPILSSSDARTAIASHLGVSQLP